LKFKDKLIRFMSGRYGNDNFNRFLSISGFVLIIIGLFVSLLFGRSNVVFYVFYALALAVMGYSIFRSMSRNVSRRFAENQKYLKCKKALSRFFGIEKIKSAVKLHRQRKADKDHVYEKCPHCKNVLRLPKVKGDHKVNCPVCHKSFGIKI